jgi:hypothetical protein
MNNAKSQHGPRSRKMPLKRSLPTWPQARYDEYASLSPKTHLKDKTNSLAPETLVSAWIEALRARLSAWSALEKRKRGRSVDAGAIARTSVLPSALVVPWGNQRAPDGLEGSLFRAVHMPTRDHPGFSAWFNMDASDDDLREKFEVFLQRARNRWPFSAKVRGQGAANPKITRDVFRKWFDWKIIPLFDIDYHFAARGESGPTPEELSKWIYKKEIDAPKISEARAMLREAMGCLPALRHMCQCGPIYHLDAKFGDSERELNEASEKKPADEPVAVLPRSTVVDINRLVSEVLASEENSEAWQLLASNGKLASRSSGIAGGAKRGAPVDIRDIDTRGLQIGIPKDSLPD